jgi:hypothetical protein
MSTQPGQTGMKPGITLPLQIILGLIVIILTGSIVYVFKFSFREKIGIPQPVNFSHRVHVNDKKISCYMCHPEAMSTARAGIPALETCMLCHARIAVTYPEIAKLRNFYFQGKPVLWNKVYYLPDFVFFNHSVHIHRQIDCSQCHGNVPLMDRIVAQQEFQMGFCVKCHRRTKATTDCFTCHR